MFSVGEEEGKRAEESLQFSRECGQFTLKLPCTFREKLFGFSIFR